jgi:hypothetical protein
MQKECVERAVRSLEVLYSLEARIPRLVQSEESAWYDYQLPLLAALAQQVYHPSKEVRGVSITLLGRMIMGDQVAESCGMKGTGEKLTRAPYTAVLLPLLDELLKPEFGMLEVGAASSLDETRMRATALLSKKFLQDLSVAVSNPNADMDQVVGLWGHVVEYMLKFVKVASEGLVRFA